MYRSPCRPQWSPGAPRQPGRFASPGSCWGFPRARSPYEGPRHRGASPRGDPAYSPGSPVYSPGSNREYMDRSPPEPLFGRGSRVLGVQMWHRGGGFRRSQSFSPKLQPSDSSLEKYFSPSMLQDPWATLQPLTPAEAVAARHAM